MLFNSYIFILAFLPITLLGYYSINRFFYKVNGTTGLVWLFMASLVFYGYQTPKYVFLIVFSIIFNYLLTKAMGKWNHKKLYFLWIGLLGNLGFLFYYKYFNFFMDTACTFNGKSWEWRYIVLPLGISFFTFQQVSYILDFYHDNEDMNYSFIEYASFVSFFPQLVAGPIVLHDELIPQLRDKRNKCVNYENMSQGLYAFSRGLGKKVLLADFFSKIVTIGYSDVASMNTGTALFVMLAYTLQIYFDFSGYCDMAIGIGKMFNIEFPVNFDSPYKAKTIQEFWNRWHKTLTRFFTKYVYIPLGGNRKGIGRTLWNTFIVFLLSGLWHGANWTFILWGTLHGLLMIVEKGMVHLGINDYLNKNRVWRILYGIYVFFFINITWIIFRAQNLSEAGRFIKSILSGGWILHESILETVEKLIEWRFLSRIGLHVFMEGHTEIIVVFFSLFAYLIVLLGKNTQEKMKQNAFDWRSAISTMILFIWSIISLSDVSEFLYFNF